MTKKNQKRILIAVLFIGAFILARYFKLDQYVTIQNIKTQSTMLKEYVEKDYVSSLLLFITFFTVMMVLSLPIVGPMSLVAGFLFGVIPGVAYSILSVTLGATISFLLVRYFLGGYVKDRYGAQLAKFEKQVKRYGSSALLSMQLVSVVPLFVINTLAALAHVPLTMFVWTTAVGAFPFVFIYTLAGRQLGTLESGYDILQPHMILLLVLLALLALLPMIVRKIQEKRGKHVDQL